MPKMLSAQSTISDLETRVGDGGVAAREQIAANRRVLCMPRTTGRSRLSGGPGRSD